MRYNHFDMLPERAFHKVGGRMTLEGGGSGGGGSQQSTQTSYQTNIPEYLRGPAERMVARGETLSEQAYQPYKGERIAGFNPAQTEAFRDIAGLETPSQYGAAGASVTGAQQFGTAGALGAMGFQPTDFTAYQMQGPQSIRASNVFGTGYDAYGAQAAPDVTGTAYQASQAGYTPTWNQQTAQQYMDPYQQAVVDMQKREATTEAQRLNQEMASRAAKAGAFGGSRFGIEQALLGKSLATNLSDIQAKGSQAAYQSGLGQFNTEQAQRQAINLANQAALNQAGQFGASQAQAANLANQQVRQQASLASQQAYNQALQFGATQAQAAQVANQQARLTASQANQQMQYQTGVQNLQSALTTQQQQEAARQQAANIQLQGAQFGAQTGLSAAERLGALGTQQQASDLQRIAAQQSAGAQQQALEQQKLDTAYQQATEMRDWEKNQLGFLSGLIRGTPFSTSQLQTTSAPGASTASQLAALGLGAYGLSSLLGRKDGGIIKMAKGGSVEGYAYGGDISAYTDKQLQDAAMGKSDVLPPDVAKQELMRRAKLRTAVQGVRAENELASGIAGLEAGNMEFADGGIVGYNGAQDSLVEEPETYGTALAKILKRQFFPGTALSEEEKLRARRSVENPLNVAEGKSFLETPIKRPPLNPPAAPAAPATKKKDEAPAAAPAVGPARAPRVTPPGTPAAGDTVNTLAVGEEPSWMKDIRARWTKSDEATAAMADEIAKGQKDVDAIRGDVKGIAALRAAAAIAQGGPGGTLAQLGRGAGAFGEEAQRGINLMQSARQGLMGQRIQLAQLERQAAQGDVNAMLVLREMGLKEPLYKAQAEQARAYAGYLNERDRGGASGGAGLASTRLYAQQLDKAIKDFGIPTTAADKLRLADLKRQRDALLSQLTPGGAGSSVSTLPKGAIVAND